MMNHEEKQIPGFQNQHGFFRFLRKSETDRFFEKNHGSPLPQNDMRTKILTEFWSGEGLISTAIIQIFPR